MSSIQRRAGVIYTEERKPTQTNLGLIHRVAYPENSTFQLRVPLV
jgi:hypothetical protein